MSETGRTSVRTLQQDSEQTKRSNFILLSMVAAAAILFTILCNISVANAGETNTDTTDIQTVSATSVDPVHKLIQTQLQAIRKRNADLAYSTTSDNLHQKYTNAQDFLGKIRFEYRPIYNYKSFEFLDRHDLNGDLLQKVSLQDHNGNKAVAVYRLKKNVSGLWQIDSFSVLYDDGQAI